MHQCEGGGGILGEWRERWCCLYQYIYQLTYMVSDENSLSQQSDQNRRGKSDADSLDTQLKCLGVLTVHKSVTL